MNALNYDETALSQRLCSLPVKSAVAFALCCASRQLNSFEAYADKFVPESREVPRHIVEKIWEVVGSSKTITMVWADELSVVERLFPPERHIWSPFHVYGGNALFSLAYTIRCLMTSDAQEAAYAARLAYEAADQAALRTLADSRDRPDIEELVISTGVVQRELRRQAEDMHALESNAPGVISRLKILATSNQLLTFSEMLV